MLADFWEEVQLAQETKGRCFFSGRPRNGIGASPVDSLTYHAFKLSALRRN